MKRVVVIGAGASGIIASIFASLNNEVIVLEKNNIMDDGEAINSNSIKLKNDKRIHEVIVNMKGGN